MGGACFNGASVKRLTYKGGRCNCVEVEVGWDGWLPAGRPERWKVQRVCDWLERSGGRWCTVVLVGGRFSFSGLKGCSQVAPILLLSLREDVVRSIWALRQSYEHFQNLLSTNLTNGILTLCLDGILIDPLSLTATQPIVRCHCHSLTALNRRDLPSLSPASGETDGRQDRPPHYRMCSSRKISTQKTLEIDEFAVSIPTCL